MRTGTLQGKLFIMCAAILIVSSVVLFIVFISAYGQELQNSEYELMSAGINDSCEKIDRRIGEYVNLIRLMVKDNGFLSLCGVAHEESALYNDIIFRYANMVDGVSSIVLITKNNNIFFPNEYAGNQPEVRETYLSFANPEGFGRRNQFLPARGYIYSIKRSLSSVSIIHDIYDPLNKYSYEGTVVLSIRENVFEQISNFYNTNSGVFFVADMSGDVLISVGNADLGLYEDQILETIRVYKNTNEYEGSFNDAAGGRDYTFLYKKLPNYQLIEIGIISNEFIYQKLSQFTLRVAFIISIFLVICLISSAIIARSITKPIKSLVAAMGKVGEEAFTIRLPVPRKDGELKTLNTGFNNMVTTINELIEDINQNTLLIKELDIKALQSQINPHLLYNTLNSIIWLMEGDENEKAIDIVSKLGKYYRLTLSPNLGVTTIGEEITQLKYYLDIEKYRLNDSFDYDIQADSAILSCKCLRIIIQPVVENSIMHGIKLKKARGSILIRIKKTKTNLKIQVVDNGGGMSREKLNEINNNTQGTNASYGIYNINSRIRLNYGDGYGLKYFSREGTGTLACLRLPDITDN